MKVSVNLTVKGTRYYKAAELHERNSLRLGRPLRLEREPHNPYDKNAVAVRVTSTGEMLGHISKELSPKYAELIDSGKIIDSSIASITKNNAYIHIDVRVVYEQSDDKLAEKHCSRFWQSSSSMPAESGVYAIHNTESGRRYIGSSANIKDRIRSHIKDLSMGSHANHVLQRDFSKFGLNCFEATVIASGVSLPNLAKMEADYISSLLKAGAALYNLTEDGQGIGRSSRGHSDSEPVSDQIAREHVEEEQTKKDRIFAEKKKHILESFELRRASLLPKTNFWTYFTTIFFVILIILPILTPNIKTWSLLILSTIGAFGASHLIQGHFIEKVKKTVQYQDLVRQCDEKLAALKNERCTRTLSPVILPKVGQQIAQKSPLPSPDKEANNTSPVGRREVTVNEDLSTRLFVECRGDEQQMKTLYIKQRTERPIYTERVAAEKAKSDQTAKAIEAFQQAVRINPDDKDAWNKLGEIYDLTAQTAKAIDAYQQAVRIMPDFDVAWYNLGDAYSSLDNEHGKAIEAFQQAVRIDPDDKYAWIRLGEIYDLTAQTAKAIEAYREAMRIDPDFANSCYPLYMNRIVGSFGQCQDHWD